MPMKILSTFGRAEISMSSLGRIKATIMDYGTRAAILAGSLLLLPLLFGYLKRPFSSVTFGPLRNQRVPRGNARKRERERERERERKHRHPRRAESDQESF